MPGDPNECRAHARECERIAAAATSSDMRETFERLAQAWHRLAGELERSRAMLDTWGDPRYPALTNGKSDGSLKEL
jgi:hypothetical protein